MVKTQLFFKGSAYAPPIEWRDPTNARRYVDAFNKAGQDPRYVARIIEEEECASAKTITM